MSVVISRSLFCDHCANWVDSRNNALALASQLRREAKRSGWARRDGEDLCPACAAAEGPERSDPSSPSRTPGLSVEEETTHE